MLSSVRKYVAAPHLSIRVWFPAVSLTAFGWLLAYDLIHPVVIYLLQLYLAF